MERIDSLVFEQGTELDEETLLHLRTCPSCRNYLEEARQAGGILGLLRRSEPVLQDPDQLTLEILQQVRNHPNGTPYRLHRTPARRSTLHLLERMLAAASVCLILVFGFEQYTVVEKIRRLEIQQTSEARRPGLPVSSLYLNTAGLSPFEAGKAIRFRSTEIASAFGLLKKRLNLIEKK